MFLSITRELLVNADAYYDDEMKKETLYRVLQ